MPKPAKIKKMNEYGYEAIRMYEQIALILIDDKEIDRDRNYF